MDSFVYILESENCDRFYIGSSQNPEKRLSEHNSGKTTSLKNKGPWKIVFRQKYSTNQKARAIEAKLKKMKNRKILERIIREKEIKISV
ncbi:MAG: GIY-YIG nuclease family protein [Candidatus Peribacteraceae bacterium]|nr:GIY-YIG nuclease family protein [Candidatus Peribacteraceae bacterium]